MQLREFGVPYEMTIVSAHRTPGRLYEYAQNARERGIRVIIAGAGLSAALPGVAAVPEPSSLLLILFGLLCMNGRQRR